MSTVALLIGERIGYSASPAIHDAAFRALGMPARYELCDVADGRELERAVERVREADCLGANVTRPHKVAVCDLVDDLSPAVGRIGAANTLVRRGERLLADNTDLGAVADELRALGRFGSAVVLGAGGASRAVQAALADAGTRVRVVDRAHWHDLAGALRDADLVVNATPVGTASDESPIPARLLRADLAVLDLVYRPSPTRLVREARATGATARDGAGMLLRQAAASFEAWTGCHAPVEAMRAALDDELGRTDG